MKIFLKYTAECCIVVCLIFLFGTWFNSCVTSASGERDKAAEAPVLRSKLDSISKENEVLKKDLFLQSEVASKVKEKEEEISFYKDLYSKLFYGDKSLEENSRNVVNDNIILTQKQKQDSLSILTLQKQVQRLSSENKILAKDKKSAEQRLQQSQQQIKDLQSQLSKLKTEKQELQKEVAELSEKKNKHTSNAAVDAGVAVATGFMMHKAMERASKRK